MGNGSNATGQAWGLPFQSRIGMTLFFGCRWGKLESLTLSTERERMFEVVLYQPEIPPNTGNAIRLCANTGCRLHLVEPLGFRVTDKELRRAGLDYHEMTVLTVHPTLETCLAALAGPLGMDGGCGVTPNPHGLWQIRHQKRAYSEKTTRHQTIFVSLKKCADRRAIIRKFGTNPLHFSLSHGTPNVPTEAQNPPCNGRIFI